MKIKPKYPIYVPSYQRHDNCLTAQFLIKDKTPFHLVVQPQERAAYQKALPTCKSIIVLPKSVKGLMATRNWIKAHSIKNGDDRHWQVDDNCRLCRRIYKGKKIQCDSNFAFRAVEDFTDRYENIAISGMNYTMFSPPQLPPFAVNNHVYSCSLINNVIPHQWRLEYNDDTDLCLQVLADGWCTVLMYAFTIDKMRTMTIKGGNTDDLYQGDGRLEMSRSLERVWPHIVKTDRRFERPQHKIRDSWKGFRTRLIRRKDIDFDKFNKVDEFGMKLKQVKKSIKSELLRNMIKEN
tara:strand:- start:10430 stop:11308 length:879 start_codon:yes stop_codon:yes gene_type:complete